jgi:hypothetical protein
MGTAAFGFAPLNLLVLVLLFGLALLIDWPLPWRKSVPVKGAAKVPRPLKSKTGEDCPYCQAAPGSHIDEEPQRQQPWREGRSRRGRKKEIPTQGYACNQPKCRYYHTMDAQVHALIGYGHHGKYERIQDLLCQACGHKFTVRRDTVLYRLKTHSARVGEVLSFMAEGVDTSVLERVLGIGEGTVHTWLTRAALHARKLHERFFQELIFRHIQFDELWANVRIEPSSNNQPLIKAVPILLEGVPEGLSLEKVGQSLTSVPDVLDIHDLHVWSLCSGHVALSAHVVTADQPLAQSEVTMAELKRRLSVLGIEHTTIQFECVTCGQGRGLAAPQAATPA